MTNNLPASDVPDLREYLFVDVPRVRMLVSQLQGGAPEITTTSHRRSRRLRAGLTVLQGERASQESHEDTLALSDLYVSMLEEDAEALGMLTDVSERARTPKFWKRGGLRRSLQPGMLLRVTAPTRIVDASRLIGIWRSFEAASNDDDQEFHQIMAMVEALYGENLSVSVLPCGPDEPSCAFLAVVSHDNDHAALDRASLLARIGPETPELTTVMQVSRVPTERDRASSTTTMMQNIEHHRAPG